MVLLLLGFVLPLGDAGPGGLEARYERARLMFERGFLEQSERVAEENLGMLAGENPRLAERFRMLAAESMLFRGMYPDALTLLGAGDKQAQGREERIRSLSIAAVAEVRLQHMAESERALAEADGLCRMGDFPVCGDVLRAHGIAAAAVGDMAGSRREFIRTLEFARAHQDRWLAASVAVNLGWAALQLGHFDEALDWSRGAERDATALGAEDLAGVAAGNLGWAYYELGDGERALEQYKLAEQSAERLGDLGSELKWISTAGYVYRDNGDLERAVEAYRRARQLAEEIQSPGDVMDALEDLAQVNLDAGRLDDAEGYLGQVEKLELTTNSRLSVNARLTEGMLAAARGKDAEAETLLKQVRGQAENPTTVRLEAGYSLGRLYAREGKRAEAEGIYREALALFEQARAELKSEEATLPFVANATRIYDDLIEMLIADKHADQALQLADQSRARTLQEALGVGGKPAQTTLVGDPRKVAAGSGATMLFYWLGPERSWLWAITPSRVGLYPLPKEGEILAQLARYQRRIQDGKSPAETGDADGLALYRTLVAPAEAELAGARQVTILADGALTQLNFETLLVPAGGARPVHYWIEDATLESAPSLATLGRAGLGGAQAVGGRMLVLGNPVTVSEDYPSLPFFGDEVRRVAGHFAAGQEAVYAGSAASPEAYLGSNPAQFGYIHFVSHAVASRTDPLESAIILSQPGAGGEYKLYARQIMERPIGARLVTLSACYGSGTRQYAGEGLVGLSWAFLHAGARSVIGALWEVSDESTPRLMDALYGGMQAGLSPAAALRQAKLGLLHGGGSFRKPFYWAPFQLYTRE